MLDPRVARWMLNFFAVMSYAGCIFGIGLILFVLSRLAIHSTEILEGMNEASVLEVLGAFVMVAVFLVVFAMVSRSLLVGARRFRETAKTIEADWQQSE